MFSFIVFDRYSKVLFIKVKIGTRFYFCQILKFSNFLIKILGISYLGRETTHIQYSFGLHIKYHFTRDELNLYENHAKFQNVMSRIAVLYVILVTLSDTLFMVLGIFVLLLIIFSIFYLVIRGKYFIKDKFFRFIWLQLSIFLTFYVNVFGNIFFL